MCEIVVEALSAPKCWVDPSPQFTTTSRMFDVLLTPMVKVAGCPADTGVVGAESVIPVRGLRLTTTLAVFPPTFAVTVAFADVVNVVVATPVSSVVAVGGDTVPASVVNVTGAPVTGAPDAFSTRAVIVAVPPDGLIGFGVAVTRT